MYKSSKRWASFTHIMGKMYGEKWLGKVWENSFVKVCEKLL